MGELRNKTVSGVLWSAIERFSTQGIGFVISLLLARVLTPSDYGVVGMLSIFFAIAQTFIDSGFSSALIRMKDPSDEDYSTAFYFNIGVGMISYLILFFAAPLIANFFDTPILKSLVKVLSLNLFFNSLTIVQSAKLTIQLDFKTLAKISLSATIFSGVLGLYMAYNGHGVWSLVVQSVSSSVVRTIFIWIATKWKPSRVFSVESFKYLFNFGVKILSANILHTIYTNLSSILIGKFYTPKDLGYYSRGESIASLPSMNLTGIVQRVTYPLLSKYQDDDSRLIAIYRKYISITSLIIFFTMFLLAALAEPLVLLLLTDKWANSVIYVQMFCFALMFDHICQLNLNILYVKGRSDLVLKLEVIKKSISIAMLIASIPFGVLAICLSRVIYTQIAIVINTYYTGKLFNFGYFAQLSDYAKYLVFSLIAVIPAFLLTFSNMSNWAILIVGGITACVLYYWFLRKDANWDELVSLVKATLKVGSIN